MPEPDRDATPEEEAAVRRLLAGVRHDEPVPEDVAARLDAVLARLSSDEPEPATVPDPAEAEVVELAARRRRRASALLVAAAAVVAVAIGVGQVADSTSQSDSTSAADRSEGAARGDAEAGSQAEPGDQDGPMAVPEQPEGTDDEGGGTDAEGGGSTFSQEPDTSALLQAPLVRITPRTFARDVRRLQDAPGLEVAERASRVPAARLSTDPAFVCATAAWGGGELIAVVYAGNPAVLAYRPATGATQSVDVLQCGTGDVVRSTTLPLP